MQLEEQLALGEAVLKAAHTEDVSRNATSARRRTAVRAPRSFAANCPSPEAAERCVIDAVVHLAVLPRHG